MIRILISGEGGQGVQAIANILTKAAFGIGKNVTFLPNFGVEQRGGVSLAFVQIAEDEISFPKFKRADLVVVLSERALKRVEGYLTQGGTLIFDNSLVDESKIKLHQIERVAIPALAFAKEKLIPKVFNMVILGAICEEVGISEKTALKEVEKYFVEKYHKEPQLKHFNQRAFEAGADTVKSVTKEQKWRKKVLV